MCDGGVVAAVTAGGPAARGGLAPGDVIAAADGHTLRDEIDWRWHADGGEVQVTLADGRTLAMTREPGEAWGVGFAEPVFDGVRTCRNRCGFCFMAQLPPGMRPALYLRDDDFRLSFLHGNFITLTNLGDDDVERIVAQALSPLYVSLHSVEPGVRERLVCARKDRALARFDELLAGGIELHVGVVLVPGVNDCDHLERTLAWLAERDGVLSIGVVPVGYTRHQNLITRSYEDAGEAASVIAQVEPWRGAFRARDGAYTVHLADEFHLNAGSELPPAAGYDGFTQLENGIGLVRSFLDAAGARPAQAPEGVTLVTGELFAPVLRGWAPGARVLAVGNRCFGGNVSVAGLLCAEDVVRAIRADGARGAYLVPDVVLNADGVTLDDVPGESLAPLSGADVRLVSSDATGACEVLACSPGVL